VNSHNIKETGEQLLERILKQRREQWQQQKLAEFAEKGKTPPKGWQDKYPETVQPDTSELPALPVGWVWATIDQFTMQTKDITDGPFGSNLKTEHYTKSGPRVIRLQNIGDGEFLDDKAHISEEHFASLSKHAIECDDILVAMMGELLPRACLVPSGVAPAIVKADCARIRVNTEIFPPKLLSYYLNSNPIRNRTKSAVKGIGRPRINLGYIRSIVVPLPSVIEQKAITDKIEAELDLIDRQIEAAALGLKQSEAQHKNILKLAFSGQLVPQDSSDEPASILLERIKVEREALAKITKPRTFRQPKKRVDTMDTLLAALTTENGWIDAQEAFKKCGITDGASTDRIEEIYSELRQLEKAGRIEIKRSGDYDQLKFIK
jgi:type I restriction enzyme S subunit